MISCLLDSTLVDPGLNFIHWRTQPLFAILLLISNRLLRI